MLMLGNSDHSGSVRVKFSDLLHHQQRKIMKNVAWLLLHLDQKASLRCWLLLLDLDQSHSQIHQIHQKKGRQFCAPILVPWNVLCWHPGVLALRLQHRTSAARASPKSMLRMTQGPVRPAWDSWDLRMSWSKNRCEMVRHERLCVSGRSWHFRPAIWDSFAPFYSYGTRIYSWCMKHVLWA